MALGVEGTVSRIPCSIFVYPLTHPETETLVAALSAPGVPRLLMCDGAEYVATPHGFASFLSGRTDALLPLCEWLRQQRPEAAFILRGSQERLFCSHGALEAMEGRHLDLVAGVFATVPEASALKTPDELPRRRR